MHLVGLSLKTSAFHAHTARIAFVQVLKLIIAGYCPQMRKLVNRVFEINTLLWRNIRLHAVGNKYNESKIQIFQKIFVIQMKREKWLIRL